MKKVFVSGGTGFIGKHVLEKFSQLGGYEIIALTRQAEKDRDGISCLRGDLSDKKIIKEAVAEVEYVVHLAGSKKDPDAFFETNVIGTENVISACSNHSVKKIVYLSSVGVIGHSNDNEINEQTPCRPTNGYEKSKYQAELIVKRFSINNPGKAIILRPANVFGEDDPEMHLLNLIKKIQGQRFYYIGHDVSKYYLNYLYVREIGELIPSILDHNANSDLYILNTPTPLVQFITTIKQIMSDDAPVKHLPFWPIKLAAAGFDLVPKSIMKHPPINSLKLSELTNKKRYSSALLEKELKWSPRFDMHCALENLIAHYYAKKLLT